MLGDNTQVTTNVINITPELNSRMTGNHVQSLDVETANETVSKTPESVSSTGIHVLSFAA